MGMRTHACARTHAHTTTHTHTLTHTHTHTHTPLYHLSHPPIPHQYNLSHPPIPHQYNLSHPPIPHLYNLALITLLPVVTCTLSCTIMHSHARSCQVTDGSDIFY